MSTSPSWFDQEKFSRLVKKVAKPAADSSSTPAKAESRPPVVTPRSLTGSQPLPDRPKLSPRQPDPMEAQQAQPEQPSLSSTAHISLVSKPPSLLAEQRALPALPRRTVPLPGINTLFPNSPAPIRASQALPEIPVEEQTEETSAEESTSDESAAPQETPVTAETEAETPAAEAPAAQEGEQDDDISDIWHKMGLLNEELAQVHQERDQLVFENNALREQLRVADESAVTAEENKATESSGAPAADLSALTKERDDAVTEAKDLREKLAKAEDDLKAQPGGGGGSNDLEKEVTLLTEERDQSRRDYMKLRSDHEMLKQEISQASKDSSAKESATDLRKDFEQKISGLNKQLEEKDKTIADLKATPAPASSSGNDDALNKAKDELSTTRDQLAKAKEESSVAQRGLILSQKALHETRDALREATEGTSLSRHNFDNLKSECATLVQQNTVLQAQNEQLLRDLGAAKSKLTTRLG